MLKTMINLTFKQQIIISLLSNIESWRATFPDGESALEYVGGPTPTNDVELIAMQAQVIAKQVNELADIIVEYSGYV